MERYDFTFLDDLAEACYANSETHGFWNEQEALEELVTRNPDLNLQGYVQQLMVGHRMCLLTTEASELMEGVRKGKDCDEHCPQFSGEEIEAADILIRLLDFCYRRGLRISAATAAKIAFNQTRPPKHGKLS